jgi:predicted nucleic acid-binding protein
MKVFIDSNIPMYVAGREHPNRASAKHFLERVRNGEIEGCTSTEVLQEILYRYSGMRRHDLVSNVYELFVQVCPVVLPITLADTDVAKDILCRADGQLTARDALHAAVMFNNSLTHIATFDVDFDAIKGISRFSL